MTNALPFPVKNPYMKQQVEQYFYRCVDVRCPDEAFHFEMLLPKEWKPVDLPAEPPSREAPSRLALCQPTAGPGAEIEVTAVQLIREMAPADWLDLFLEARGETIVERRTVETPGGAVPDVLTRCETPQGVVVSRWLLLKDYNRLFLIQARCLEAHYRAHALPFFMALISFQLLNPVGWPFAENLQSYSRRLPGDFCLFYPESWTLEEDPASSEQVREMHLINQVEQDVLGTMTVMTLARGLEENPRRLVDWFVEHLRQKGMSMPDVPLVPVEPVGGFLATWQGHAKARQDSGATELRLTIGKRPDAWFLLALRGPSRDVSAAVWAINRRAYDVLLDQFRTPTAEQLAAVGSAGAEGGGSCAHDYH